MIDQAASLRKQLQLNNGAKVISIVSGKGGVGKSNVSLNLALTLAKKGKKVLLIDLDIGMANVDLLLGRPSQKNIMDVLEHEISIWDIVQEAPFGLNTIAGGRHLSGLVHVSSQMMNHFLKEMEEAEGIYDFIFLDMGAGATETSLNFVLASHEVFIVATPEVTSMTDAYSMIKFIYGRDPSIPFSILINRCENEREGEASADRIIDVAKKFLNTDITRMGSVPYDMNVIQAVKKQQPFVIRFPGTKASIAIEKVAQHFCGQTFVREKRAYTKFFSKLKTLWAERQA